jgi:hypothetical protein
VSQNKEIKLQFSVDERSAQQAQRVIRDLIGDAQKLAQALGGVNIGGAGGLTGGGGLLTGSVGGPQSQQRMISHSQGQPKATNFAATLLENANSLKGLANISKDSMRIMSDGIKRAVDEQKRSLASLDDQLAKLAKRYDDLGQRRAMMIANGATPEQADIAVGAHTTRIAAEQAGIHAQKQKLHDDMSQLDEHRRQMAIAADPYAHLGGPEDEPIPGRMQRFGSWLGSKVPLRNSHGQLFRGGTMGLAAATIGVANFGLDETLAGDRSFATAGAQRADLVSGHIRSMMGGDVKLIHALRTLDNQQKADLQAQSGTAATLEQYRAGVGQLAGSTPIVGGVLRGLGIVGPDQGGGALGGFNDAKQDTNMAANTLGRAEELQRQNFMFNMAADSFTGSLGSRVQAQRMIGLGGLRFVDPKRGYVDSYGNLANKLQAEGYSIDEYVGATSGLQNSAGSQFGGRYGYAAMAAAASGLGGFGTILGAGARAGAGANLAYGALGGGIDQYAGQQLGIGIAGQGFDPMGTTSGLGLLAAAQSGMGFTGGVGDFQRVGQVQAGVDLGSRITTGGLDPYQRGRNLVSAIGVAGPGASTYTQDYLANGVNFKQMIDMAGGASLTKTAFALGLDPSHFKKQLGAQASSVLDRFVDQGGSDPMSKSIRAFRKSGDKDLGAYLQNLKDPNAQNDKDSLGAAIGLLSGQGEEAGLGLIGLLSGDADPSKIKKGKVGGKIGGTEKDALEGMADAAKRVTKVLEANAEQLGKDFKAIPDATKKMQAFGENLGETAEIFTKSLLGLADTINKVSTSLKVNAGLARAGAR